MHCSTAYRHGNARTGKCTPPQRNSPQINKRNGEPILCNVHSILVCKKDKTYKESYLCILNCFICETTTAHGSLTSGSLAEEYLTSKPKPDQSFDFL